MLANSTHVMPPIGGIDEIPQRGQVYDYVYVQCMHRLSLAYDRMHEREVLIFLCMMLIMYGIKQVFRLYVRLATGPGGLTPIWILGPVAVRISGALQSGIRALGSYGRT